MDDDTPWLDEAQRRAWLPLVGVMQRLPAALDTGTRRATGLTVFEYIVLALLSEEPGRRQRMSDLALTVQASLSRLSHVVSRLEERGWLERSPDPDDGRATTVSVTDAGWAQVQVAAPRHVRVVRELVVDALSPAQFAQLGEIATVLLDRLDAVVGPAPRPDRRP